MAKISCTNGALKGQEITVPEAGLTLGRSAKANVVVNDQLVSGEHVTIRMQDGAWWVFDMRSSNGTQLNGAAVEANTLKDGDVIQIGTTQFKFDPKGEAKGSYDKAKALESRQDTIATPPVADVKKAPQAVAEKGKAAVTPEPPPAELTQDDVASIKEISVIYERMKEQLGQVIVGQAEVIDEVLMAILCRGHALLVGVPGLAKTLLISTLSHVMDLGFKRVQFTPDLMPSDITGTDVLEEDRATGKRSFRFVQGPIFTNMLLADEINRTPPKTQAALLEAMQEHRVTVGDTSYRLPEPFFVLATQNPIEQEGTYPLPEAQLDRFLFNIVVKYPTAEEEHQIIRQVTGEHKPSLQVSLNAQQVLRLQQVVRRVPVADHVIKFACDIARATRPKEKEAPAFIKELVGWGAGPRAGISLITAAKARAVLKGRFHATTADVSAVAFPVLRHRVITTFNAEAAGVTSDQIVKQLIDHLRPGEYLDV